MVELKNVSFSYEHGGQDNGIQNIDLTVQRGEVVLLCGESGCGKTTITRLINGLIPGYYAGTLTGDVLVDGKNVRQIPLYETAQMVGSVFQNPRSQFFNVDTTSELAFGCENKGLPEQEILRRIEETVHDFRMEPLMDRSIFKLSGGEKQKIACASVTTCYPEVFVLDEPSSNLDAAAIEDLKNLIGQWKKRGKTIIVAEHRLHYLRELADRIVYLKNGHIDRELSVAQMKGLSAAELSDMGLRPFSLECLASDCVPKLDCSDQKLSISEFSFSYKGCAPAVHIENPLDIPWGAVVAAIGYNGAGKSTFARCLCGLEQRCQGIVKVCKTETRHSERLKRSYMVMQDVNHQLFTESVLDEVLLSMENENEEAAERILDSLDLLPFKAQHPMALSGGQKQRVAIASAVASGKDIVIFDEPTSGLDLRHMREVASSIWQLARMGKMLFVISHDLELILSCCTYVLHFEQGRIKDHYTLDQNGRAKMMRYFTR